MPISILENISPETFYEHGYLQANLDVARAIKSNGSTGEEHYKNGGHAENRRQVSKQFLEGGHDYFTQKFARFRSVLKANAPFRFLRNEDAFPIVYGDRHFTSSDYSVDSMGGDFGPFKNLLLEKPDGLYMDLGAGLRHELFEQCLYLEVYPSITSDIVVDPTCEYPIESGSLDGILCAAVLEHTTKPWLVASEIRRMLKPGGKAFINWPFLQPVHGYPSHYYNATRMGLEILFTDGFEIHSNTTGWYEDPAFTFHWYLLSIGAQMREPERTEFRSMTVGALSDIPPGHNFWRRMISALPDAAIQELACGNTLIATKVD